jgi:hypothetical protein
VVVSQVVGTARGAAEAVSGATSRNSATAREKHWRMGFPPSEISDYFKISIPESRNNSNCQSERLAGQSDSNL